MIKLPAPAIKLTNGVLSCPGETIEQRLAAWQKEVGLPNEVEVYVVTAKRLQEIVDELNSLRSFPFAA